MSDSLISQKAAPSDTWRQFSLPPSTLLAMKLTPAISNARYTNSTFNAHLRLPSGRQYQSLLNVLHKFGLL